MGPIAVLKSIQLIDRGQLLVPRSDESIAFLSIATGLDDLEGAAQVADALAHLPVALTQAVTTIRLTGCDYAGYQALLRDRRLPVTLRRDDGEPYPESVATALATAVSTALDSLDSPERAVAKQLLDAMTLLAGTGIPRTWVNHIGDDPIAAQVAVGRLIDTNILTPAAPPATEISLHRLLASAIRETQSDTDVDTAVATATLLIRSAITISDKIPYMERRAAIAVAAAQLAALATQTHSTRLTRNFNLLAVAQDVAYRSNRLQSPYPTISLAPYLDIRERILGRDHPDTLRSRNELAFAHQLAGHLGGAASLYELNLTEAERILGSDHPTTLSNRNNLAGCYEAAGDLGRAIPLYAQTLTDRERILAPEDPDTLTSRHNLAWAYMTAGYVGEAIPLLERTLVDRERVLGPDHPDTLLSRNNLTGAYQSTGDLRRAIPLLERTLADRERVLGPDHPDTIQSRSNLGGGHYAAGEVERALPHFEQALVDMERVQGPDHPSTIRSRNVLASAIFAAGDKERAILAFEQALADAERVLGVQHPQTAKIRSNLAVAREKRA